MNLSKTGLTFVLGAAITSATPAPLLAQTCSQVVANLQARTAALNNEARVNSANFLRDELVGPALETAKRTLEGTGDPTVAAYNQVQDAREKAQAWLDRLNSYDAFFRRLQECGATGCNMFDFIEKEKARSRLAEAAQDKLNEWVQSLGDNGITAAAERVSKISSIVKNTVSGAQGIAQDGITDAVSCMGQYVQTAQAARADQIDPGVTAPGATAPPPSSGSGIGKAIGLSLLTAGSVAVGLYAASQVETEVDTFTGSPNTTTTSNNPAPVSNTPATVGLGTFSCSVANDTSGFRNCLGSINVRAGTLIGARQGSTIAVLVVPSAFVGTFVAPASGGTTGTVSLRATLPRSCATQTTIAFSPGGTTAVFESISVSIPVSCP